MEIIFAICGILAGWMVISANNPVHSVLSLVLAFANLSILLLLLGLEFLPLLFIIVYVGAIAILFLFVIMMLNIKIVEILDNTSRYIPIGIFIGFIFLWQIYLAFNTELISLPQTLDFYNYDLINNISNVKQLGMLLYTNYFIYFFIGGLILLVAMIGAIVLTITHEEAIKRQDLFAQITTKFNENIKNVK